MSESIKIASIHVENFKRVELIDLVIPDAGLVFIGGPNRQGKTSASDAAAWALGGDTFKPSKPNRDGADFPAEVSVTLSNGLVARRAGKNGALTVTTETGLKGNQTTLNSAIERLALDLPAFRKKSPKEKALDLLRVIGLGAELAEREKAIEIAYNARREAGILADSAEKQLAGPERYPDAAKEESSVSALAQELREIEESNRLFDKEMLSEKTTVSEVDDLKGQIAGLKDCLADAETRLSNTQAWLEGKSKVDAGPIQAKLNTAEEDNAKVRANKVYAEKSFDAKAFRITHGEREKDVVKARAARQALLDGAEMPIEGLGIEDGELTYLGQKQDCWSGSEELRICASIVAKLNPKCGFALIGEVAEFDLPTLRNFRAWCEGENLQLLATRPSTGSECNFIVENGRIKAADNE